MLIFIVYRYQPILSLISRLSQLHQQYRLVSKQLDRLKKKIAEASEVSGVTLDEQTHEDLRRWWHHQRVRWFLTAFPNQHLFWQQQVEAASKKKAQNMRWHPLMIRWCIYLRHRWVHNNMLHHVVYCTYTHTTLDPVAHMRPCEIPAVYIKLPSQRTVRDNTHYVRASTGFSSEVDKMLF